MNQTFCNINESESRKKQAAEILFKAFKDVGKDA